MLELFSKEILGVLAVGFGLVCFIPYLLSISKGKAKPHVFTWVIWSIMMSIAFAAQWSEGAGAGSWVTGVGGVFCGLIAIVAVKHGEKNITRSDKISLIAALCAIPLWYVTKDPLFSVVLITLIDMLGYYPTYRKSYYKPYEEVALTFFLAACGYSLALFALENYNITTYLYPATLLVADFSMVCFLLIRRRIVAV